MTRIWTIAMKDLRLLSRDKGGLFFVVVFPFLMAVFFGTIFSSGGGSGGGPSGIPVAVVDEDGSERSAALTRSLEGAGELRVHTTVDNQPITRGRAEDMVRRGSLTAMLVIPQGYGSPERSLFWGEAPGLELGVDPSRNAAGSMVEGIITKYAYQDFAQIFTDPGAMRREMEKNLSLVTKSTTLDPLVRGLLTQMFGSIDAFMAHSLAQSDSGGEGNGAGFNPVTIHKREIAPEAVKERRNAYAWTFPQGVMWGVAGCAAAFGISLVSERSKGTLVRLRSSPLSWGQILAGKGLACFLTTMLVGTALLVTARLVFGVVPTSAPLVALGLLATAVCFVGLMMLLSVAGRTEASASGIGWAVILVLMMVGGAAVPLDVMPQWMRSAASVSPVKWGLVAIEGGLWRGYEAADMFLPCGILIVAGVLTGAAGVMAFRALEMRS